MSQFLRRNGLEPGKQCCPQGGNSPQTRVVSVSGRVVQGYAQKPSIYSVITHPLCLRPASKRTPSHWIKRNPMAALHIRTYKPR